MTFTKSEIGGRHTYIVLLIFMFTRLCIVSNPVRTKPLTMFANRPVPETSVARE